MILPRSARPVLAAVATAAIGLTLLIAQPAPTPGAKMANVANTFLTSLTPELKQKAAYPFDSPERLNWHFVPLQDQDRRPTRKGVSLEEMNDAQKMAALDLLRAGLSAKGYEQATTIMSLESILADLEKNGAMVRNPNWYFVTIFGEPSNTGRWGWRVEGHHLSVNITLDRGVVQSPTPLVFAANPAEIKDGPKKGLRTLPETEDPVKELIASLNPEQQKLARQPKQFPEIAATPKPTVGPPLGLPAEKMTAAQQKILLKLMEGYTSRLPAEVAAQEMKRATEAGLEKVHFAYCIEEDKPGKPYTYRVQGPTFVIEFLNVQADSARNPANHIHSAWRRLPADFGLEEK
jgi:hypothetical protein